MGFMVVGPNEGDRLLKRVLEQRKSLVDDMVIVGNNTDKKTERVIKDTGFWFYRDDREWGIHQPDIKNDLLAKVGKLKPDWILASDADELYGKAYTREEEETLAQKGAIAWYFALINLWGDERHYRHDMSFWNIRYFQYRPDLGLTFQRTNVHCGLAPPPAYIYGCHAPHMVKHYGVMNEELRNEKIERYKKYDPNDRLKGEYYRKLRGEWDSKPLIRSFDEEEMQKRIKRDVEVNFKHEHNKYDTERHPIR